MAYLVDANVLIQAKNFHYDFEFCPAFWEWLLDANRRERAFSVEKVNEELQRGNDLLATWASERGETFFLKPDAALPAALARVAAWAAAGQWFEPQAVSTFLVAADYYIVAHALAHGHTVVTHETVSESRRRIKIPVACNALGIRCVTPFQMLRHERARFVLGQEG